jgi:L-lactate permease
MSEFIEICIVLLPFVVLIGGFLIFRLDALAASFYALAIELVVALFYYHMPLLKSVEASLWGNLTMWTGFLVLYTGQIFGQSYRATGQLQILLDSVESIFSSRDKEGRAIALVTVVGGFIGAFNGFATYPVTIPGLVELGFDGFHAVTAYLVYFSWSVPFVSMFIGANISSAATHLPVPQIAQTVGLLCIPLVFVSLFGFFRILGFRFFSKETQILFWLLGLANVAGIVLFTQIWPAYYLMTLIAGSAISLVLLYGYGALTRNRKPGAAADNAADAKMAAGQAHSWPALGKAYAPLVIGVVFVLLTMVPSIAKAMNSLQFSVAAWGYGKISINIFTSAGFFILVTALSCYLFRQKKSNIGTDFVLASKRSFSSLATLFVGSAMVYLMVDTGQIDFLGKVLSGSGTVVYATLNPFMTFLGGMAFGQGLPGDFMFAKMQIPVAQTLGIPLLLLVGIVTVVTMGPPNPIKPALIRYTASLVGIKGKDGEIFRVCLPWQLLQVVVVAVFSLILILI